MYTMSYKGFLEGLGRTSHIYVKATDEETSDIFGHASWVFRGVDQKVVPTDGPEDDKPIEEEPVTESTNVTGNEQRDYGETKELNSIDRLHALEHADIQD